MPVKLGVYAEYYTTISLVPLPVTCDVNHAAEETYVEATDHKAR